MLYARLDGSLGDPTALNLLEWKICITVLHAISIASTVFRIWYRHRISRLWWDDYWAIVPLTFESVYLVVMWLRVQVSHPTNFINNQIALYWLSAIPFVCILWTARICLALSIARVFAPGTPPRRFVLGLIVIFSLTCLAMIAARIVSCVRDPNAARHYYELAHCSQGEALCIAGFTFDIISDVTLTISPLYLLWRVKLPTTERRLILAVFSASFWTLLGAIAYCLCVFSPINQTPAGPVLLIMMPHVEAAIAVLVCNLPVVVSYFYCTFRQSGDIDMMTTREVPSKTVPMITATTTPGFFNSSVLALTTILTTESSFAYSGSLYHVEQGLDSGTKSYSSAHSVHVVDH